MFHRRPEPAQYPRVRVAFERWHADHRLNPRRFRVWIGLATVLLAMFMTFALPYVLPLPGPEPQDPVALADPGGTFVTIEGERLYTVHAAGTRTTVVLLHGFGGGTVTWTGTIDALTDAGYEVYAVDLLGFGLSDKGWTHDYRTAAHAARVVALLDQASVERAAFVGHSMGGRVAATIALDYPDRVSALALVAPALGEGSPTVPGWVFDVPGVRRWVQIGLRAAAPRLFDDLLADAAYNDAALTPAVRAGYRRVLDTPGWELALLGMLRDGETGAARSLSGVSIPVLLLWGARDTWVPPDGAAAIRGDLPNAERVTLPEVGHLPMHEAPDAFNAALIDFLDRQAAITP